MDGIVGKTYLTYNSLPPCHEIDISCHKLNQNDNFVSKYPNSVAAILKLCFRDHVTQIFQLTPILAARNPDWQLGLNLMIGTLRTVSNDQIWIRLTAHPSGVLPNGQENHHNLAHLYQRHFINPLIFFFTIGCWQLVIFVMVTLV